MDRRKRLVGPGLAVFWAAVAGCVTMGRPLPESPRAYAQATRSPEVPLVPVPPPPVGVPEQPPAKAPVAATPTAAPRMPPAGDAATPPATITARQLYQASLDRYQAFDSYIVRLIRREVVKGEMKPEEVILFKFRKEPWSVYFKWLGKEGQGREVVYVKGRHEGKIHTLLAAGDIPLVPAGKRMALAPDSIFVKSASRHPITEAGLGACLERLGHVLAATERGDRKFGQLTLVGPAQRPEFEKPVLGLEHELPPGLDPSLPRGGKRTHFFDPDTSLPMLVTAKDERGLDVEYYRYDRLQAGVKLDDNDFDPDKLWAKPKDDGR
jgi:hypothetical protein